MIETHPPLRAPFPYFGGKRTVAEYVWRRFGTVKQYIEPFCGSAAMLLSAQPSPLEVIGDMNCYVANFWRATKYDADLVWSWSDYPVSHLDLGARHAWLTASDRVAALRASLADPDWPGDPKIAGWWLWGQCAWIGSGWCEKENTVAGKIPVCEPGKGVQSPGIGQIPFVGSAGMGLQAGGVGDFHFGAGTDECPAALHRHVEDLSPWQSGARAWLRALSRRLERVRVIHGSWDRCLNHHYGGNATAVFLDPPYVAFEKLYAQAASAPVAHDVARWAAENAEIKIAVCGHIGDYDGILDGWEAYRWTRDRTTYGSSETRDDECIWFSPACLPDGGPKQRSLF